MVYRRVLRFVLALLALSAAGAFVDAQSTTPPAPTEFDAASIKENKSGDDGVSMNPSPAGITVTNATLQMILRLAFRVQDDQIVSGPAWLTTARFDIVAKRDSSGSLDVLRPMLQALLADRFRLATHHETRELPVYVLAAVRNDGKLGPQIRTPSHCVSPTAAQQDGQTTNPQAACGNGLIPGNMSSRGITARALAVNLSVFVGRTVVDRTGLTETLDVDLMWSPDVAGNIVSDRPSLFAALQEQLGLKLESARAPVDVVVIDHVERPSPD